MCGQRLNKSQIALKCVMAEGHAGYFLTSLPVTKCNYLFFSIYSSRIINYV